MESRELTWRKSSRSGTNGGGCVEVTDLRGRVMVRDSTDPDGPRLDMNGTDWCALVESLRR